MNLEAFEEVPNAVEEVNKRVVTGANILGRLVVSYCHKESKRGESTNHKEETNTAEDCGCWRESLKRWAVRRPSSEEGHLKRPYQAHTIAKCERKRA